MVPARLAEAVLPTVASLPATKLRYFQFAALGVKMCVQVEKMVVSILVSTGRMLAETYYAPPFICRATAAVTLVGDAEGATSTETVRLGKKARLMLGKGRLDVPGFRAGVLNSPSPVRAWCGAGTTGSAGAPRQSRTWLIY